jgi:hypothetical protein
MDYPDLISIQTNDDTLTVDWVCLEQTSPGDGWRFREIQCEFPTFDDHPVFSVVDLLYADPGSNWLWWLANKIGDLVKWIICMIELIIAQAANSILDVSDQIDFPELPEDLSIGSLILWLRETYKAFGNWLGESLQNIVFSGETLGEWLRSQFIEIADWFWEDILLELIHWAMDQAEAAGLISEDMIWRLRFLWRDADMFIDAIEDELLYEWNDLQALAGQTADVFWVLLVGWQSSLSGDAELDMGESLGGFAAYLWRGVEFVDEVVTITPLSALNIVGLGIIGWGLGAWTLSRFVSMLERLA